mmetsp:Transcript_48312/g.127868  ORF Transcript_48312/g.127868 Transcript_48312/m.127868 type:complete len:210 (-) Transcript_48312:173-802(-)
MTFVSRSSIGTTSAGLQGRGQSVHPWNFSRIHAARPPGLSLRRAPMVSGLLDCSWKYPVFSHNIAKNGKIGNNFPFSSAVSKSSRKLPSTDRRPITGNKFRCMPRISPAGARWLIAMDVIAPQSPPCRKYCLYPKRLISSRMMFATSIGSKPGTEAGSDHPKPGREGTTRWARLPSSLTTCWNSTTDPGHPWIIIIAGAASWSDLTCQK